jgi:hypothetical protein
VHSRARRLTLAIAGSVGLAALVHAQAAPAARPDLPRVAGSEISSELSWQRVNNLTFESHTVVFGDAPFHVVFSTVYPGLKPPAPPESVDLVIVREAPTPGDVRTSGDAPPVVALIDGLPVPLTKQANDGPDRIKSTLPLEVFQWMVGGDALAFEVFGRRLELVPGQMQILKQIAEDWAKPGKTDVRRKN